MFDSKKTQLFSMPEKKKTTSDSPFVQAGLKKKAQVLSGNGAIKYSTTGNAFVDQFGKMGEYKKPRSFSDIEKDCEALWAIDPLRAIKMSFYIRTITRPTDLLGKTTSITQRGAELKHEGIMRLIWLATKDQQAFIKNLWVLPVLGSWKDIITMLQYDLVYHGWGGRVLPWVRFGDLLLSALGDKNTCELVKKYIPSIKTNSKCTTVEAQADTMIAKWLCGLLYPEYVDSPDEVHGKFHKKYRKMKTSGTAHEWQKLISQKKFDRIDFGKIHGRALSLLVRSKFLKRQGLQDKYAAWVKKPTTEVKYTGYVHELFSELFRGSMSAKYPTLASVPEHMRDTINKQFVTLVNKGKSEDHTTSLIVVRDTSGSMMSTATGTNMSSYGISKALGLYFAEFLEGPFANSWIEFNSGAKMHQWTGKTPIEKWFNDTSSVVGGTDFQSVVKLFCQIKAQGVPESQFPSGILCISDGEFNPAMASKTNVESMLLTLRNAGFSEDYVSNFVIVFWNIPNQYYGAMSRTKFETYGSISNVFYFGSYSASIVAFLTSKIRTAAELVDVALDQEVLNLVKL